jgi:hypothetical protein
MPKKLFIYNFLRGGKLLKPGPFQGQRGGFAALIALLVMELIFKLFFGGKFRPNSEQVSRRGPCYRQNKKNQN